MNLNLHKTSLLLIALGMATSLCAQTLTNLGPTAPTPGVNDISQLSTSGNTTWPDGINYFSNNNPPAGQIFTTGTNALNLASIAVKTAGLNHDSNYGNPSLTPTYYLRIYSISGSTATLLATFSAANPGFTDGNWLKWSGLNVPLGTNQTYAFTFGIPNDASWVALAVCSANAYAGGEIVTIPTGGGTVNTGGSHAYDAVFSVGLVQPTTPSVGSITVSPWTNVPAGVRLTLGAAAGGASPLSYQWQFNDGSGFVTLSGGNTNLLSFVSAVTNTGSYRLVLNNSYGSVTSAPVALAVSPGFTNIPASMPFPLPTYGMNIGNKLELSWGAPNPGVLYNAAYNGFNAVRVPCAWNHNATTNISGGVTNYPINASYMAQVKQTVDAAIDAGMYVMINDHWDDGWLESSITTNLDATINAKMKDYWTQIATTFAGYDNHLLFAAANEPNVHNTSEQAVLMYYYQTFVNAVRGVGGNNTNRWLVLPSVVDPTWVNALPTDTVSNRLMLEFHNYTPSLFSIIHSDQSWGTAIYFWGAAYHYAGNPSRNATWGEEYDTDAGYQQLADLYVSKGIPVMIGEFGASGVSLTDPTEAAYNAASVLYWDKYLAESARVHGLSPFYWSTGNSPFDYDTAENKNPALIAALTGGAAPPPPNGAPYAPSNLTATGGASQVTLSWTAGSGATSYNLYRATTSGGGSAIAPVVTGITGTSYTNTGLASGTTYYYQVVAVNASGLSGFSPEAKATTFGASVTDPAQFNFESTVQGWTGGGGIVSSVATSATQKYSGNQSLAVNFNGTASGTASPNVGNVSVNPGTTITFRVWIPSGSTITALQPYLQYNNWSGWASSWYGSFTPNAWNTLTLTVPANATSPLNVLGIQIMTSGAWTGTCYIDSVSWPAAGPDFNLTVNPTSLTLNAGTSGTSTVTVTALNNLNACYTLSAGNLPSGVTATFTNNPNIGGTSLLTLTASSNVVSGTANVSVVATAGLISHTQTIALTLNGVTLPATPANLAATPGDSQVGLTWTAAAGATSYNIKRATVNGGPYSTVANVATTSFTDSGLANGTAYYYAVSAVNAAGESANSTQASATPTAPTVPPAPTGLIAVGGNAQVGLTWSAASGATSYNVKRATTSGGPYTTVANVATTSFTDTGLANGTTYYYVVSAMNSAGESGNSTQAGATPQLPAPSAPTGLAASAGDSQVGLTWSAASAATSYNVKRATVNGGPYTTLANVATTSYTDTGVVNDTTYYYVVSAVNAAGESANSAQASATPSAPSLPSPWVTADIGAVGATGSASYSGGTYTVTGSGADIWNTADEFRYVYQPSSSTCDISARVATIQNTHASAKAGVMIRESTAPGARCVAVFITPGSGVTFQWRASTGGTYSQAQVTGVTAPRYVRIQRASGNSFRAYYSSNGSSWTQIGSNQKISMATGATIGLAVTSHNDGTLCTSTLDTVNVTP